MQARLEDALREQLKARCAPADSAMRRTLSLAKNAGIERRRSLDGDEAMLAARLSAPVRKHLTGAG